MEDNENNYVEVVLRSHAEAAVLHSHGEALAVEQSHSHEDNLEAVVHHSQVVVVVQHNDAHNC